MIERLKDFIEYRVTIVTKGHHIGYSIMKGILISVGEDYVELDGGGKTIIIAKNHISTFTVKY